MPNVKYNKGKVIEVILEYIFSQNEKCTSMPFEKLYSEIVKYVSSNHKKIKMPAFSQARKIIISELGLPKGTRLTSKVVYNVIKNNYYNNEKIEDVLLNEYSLSVYCDTPIICTVKLSSVEQLDIIAKNRSKQNKKSVEWGRINLMQNLLSKIKKKNKNILAVIPEFNRMIYLNKDGKIDKSTKNFNPLCDTFCVFIKNNEDGRAFVEKIKKSPHSLTEIMRE